jgi:hypothetical protein
MPHLFGDEGPILQPNWKEVEKIIKKELKQIRPEYLKSLLTSLKTDHVKQLKGGSNH